VLYRLCDEKVFVVEKAGDAARFNTGGEEKGGCARDAL
jgi:hypothetical protein